MAATLMAASQVESPAPRPSGLICHPEGDAIAIQNGERWENRPLYCHERFSFVWAGEMPGLRGESGIIRFGFERDGKRRMLDQFSERVMRYRPGWIEWECRDVAFPGLTISVVATTLADANGITARIASKGAQSGDIALWVAFTPDADKALDPATVADPVKAFQQGMARAKDFSRRLVIDTPDPYLNAGAPMVTAAAAGIFVNPTFVHGGSHWRQQQPGWRTMGGAIHFGWPDHIQRAVEFWGNLQVKVDDEKHQHAEYSPNGCQQAATRAFSAKGSSTTNNRRITNSRPSSSTKPCGPGAPVPTRSWRKSCARCWSCTSSAPRIVTIPMEMAFTKVITILGRMIPSGSTVGISILNPE
jgi:hypothetical protein